MNTARQIASPERSPWLRLGDKAWAERRAEARAASDRDHARLKAAVLVGPLSAMEAASLRVIDLGMAQAIAGSAVREAGFRARAREIMGDDQSAIDTDYLNTVDLAMKLAASVVAVGPVATQAETRAAEGIGAWFAREAV